MFSRVMKAAKALCTSWIWSSEVEGIKVKPPSYPATLAGLHKVSFDKLTDVCVLLCLRTESQHNIKITNPVINIISS
ncbi:hypothetical protein V2G26_005535 [Clonostachys chloroleuca]